MASKMANAHFELFLRRLAAGGNPLTGAALPSDSPWLHDEIKAAVAEILSLDQSSGEPNRAVSLNYENRELRQFEKLFSVFSREQAQIWNAIEDSIDGIDFSSICNSTGFSPAKIQGCMGNMTKKARIIFGAKRSIFEKRNQFYFPQGIRSDKGNGETPEVSTPSGCAQKTSNAKPKHINAYETWDEDQDQRLILLWQRDLSINELSKLLGRTPGAIRSRLTKLSVIQNSFGGGQMAISE